MKSISLFTLLTLTLLTFSTQAQFYGVNKVQYEDFDWHYIQSEHFDVYFYDGGYDIARFTAEVAETSYVSIKNTFKFEITERVAIIVYKSHNDFQQTNVVYSYLSEGIGGVTELFKNRIVIPYEGNYDQFRHVIHHELVHAVMNDMLYGGSVQSLVSGQVVQTPLWFSEGMAEYESQRWTPELDMVVRDATITGYLPPIDFLDYMPYQGGASVLRYIAQKYGDEKIGEILNKVKGSFRFESAFRSALGIDFKDLTEEWQKQMKREYWPDIADRKEPSEIAKPLTDHREEKNYRNASPAISPMGDKVVFLSDRDGGYLSIFLLDVHEGEVEEKLISGEISEDFEELHFLTPGMSWSPDGKKIVFAAKAGDSDALYILDVQSEDMEQYKLESLNFDGIFSPTWSTTDNRIAFVGNIDGASDIYLYDLDFKKVENITNDVFSDKNPSWSPDGKKIVFTSDRGSFINDNISVTEFDMHNHDFVNDDIYIIELDNYSVTRITDKESKEDFAIFFPSSDSLAYISNETGISNIYFHDLNTHQSSPVTNIITGVFQLGFDKKAQKLVFTSFYQGGWDIFLLKNPTELEPVKLELTEFFKTREKEKLQINEVKTFAEIMDDTTDAGVKAPKVRDYSKFVFADIERRTPEEKEVVELDESDYKNDDGEYKVKNYKIKFSPDIINGAAGYDTYFGLQGYTQIALSDMIGDHKIFIGTDLVFDLRNSSLSLQYWYLPNRIDYGISAYHVTNFFRTSTEGLFRFRNYGVALSMSRPFNKFSRIDLSLNWYNINLEYLELNNSDTRITTILPKISYVRDQVRWGMTGPMDGSRSVISATFSPKYTDNSLDFQTFKLDYRKYLPIARGYSFAVRLFTGMSQGNNPQTFYLGGVNNWFNRSFNGGLRIENIEDVFFSEFVTPLRGARYYEQDGNNFGLVNLEFRFPLIPYMQLGFPPITLGNIQGAFFADVGSAWDETNLWKGVYKDDTGQTRMRDLISGYGVGARIYIFGLLLRWDVAWRYDIATTSKPKYYWSIGADF